MNPKNVVITGAGGVLCSCFAKALAGEGCKVALLDRNLAAAQQVADAITRAGGKAFAVEADVLDKESLREAAEAVHRAIGPCEILINGAGGNHPKGTTSGEFFDPRDLCTPGRTSFFDLEPEGAQFVFDLNFMGTFLVTQVFAKDMVETGGVILNVSSMNAFRPLTKIPAYSGAKAAVQNFTQWLAVHFAPANIRVNAIAPGFFVTNQNKGMLFEADGTPTPRTEKILSQTPMGRFGEPEELLGTVKYLLDDEMSGFVTGVVVPVDGGFSAYSGV